MSTLPTILYQKNAAGQNLRTFLSFLLLLSLDSLRDNKKTVSSVKSVPKNKVSDKFRQNRILLYLRFHPNDEERLVL